MTDSNTRPKEEETNQSSILGFDLSPSFIKEVEILYNSRVGREIILSDLRVQQGQGMNDDDFGNSLNDAFQEYVKGHFYNSKGNESNVVIHGVDDDDDDVGGKTYNVLMYTERIQLHQYHAGSWFAKYTIHRPTKDSKKVTMDGKVQLHAHTFENGNVQLKSNITLPSCTCTTSSSSTSQGALIEGIMAQIQQWDDQFVLQPLEGVYHDISSEILKKLRRVMPVTRTKFDWNLEGHRFVKAVSLDVQGGK